MLLVGIMAGSMSAQDARSKAPARRAGELRVLAFNIWQEGTSVPDGFARIVDVIVASDADLVVLSEVRNYDGKDLHERLLEALRKKGRRYFGRFGGGDVGLLSRWSLEDTKIVYSIKGSIIAYELEQPSRLVVCCTHLDYRNYAVYLPRGYDGNSFQLIDANGDGEPDPILDPEVLDAMDAASGRDEAHAALLAYMAKLPKEVPLIYAGDFNECSDLDWTEATKDLQSHNGLAHAWKHSRRLRAAGLVDCWRRLFPDPVTHPGATWPAPATDKKSTSWAPLVDERDRIDFVYARGLHPRRAWLVGPASYWVKGKLESLKTLCPHVLQDLPWPSDHKAVLVDLAR